MDAFHDASGELTLKLVERDPDASAASGLDTLNHGVRLIAVLPGDFHNACSGFLFDSRRLFQRFGNRGFRQSADFSDFF